ncbi:hypothetical protein AB0I90_21755 [Micromonospora wenchangensis]|uniref:hypothetical protein n=1 Tax=Micromonospora wenchangensis TaxID=1185415 RepID=UPI0033CCE851
MRRRKGWACRVSSCTAEGPLCLNCCPLPVLVCSICGLTAPGNHSKLTGLPRCRGCFQRQARCTTCGRVRGIHSGTADAPVCGPCTKPDAELWHPCPTCGQAERLRSPGPCRRCTLKQRLHELLADDSGSIPPKSQALNDALAKTERVGTAMRWLAGGIVSTVLSDLGSGHRPLTHEALDELPAGKVVEHLRNVLVATGTLPQRDEQMVRLERHVNDLVTSHATAEGRKFCTGTRPGISCDGSAAGAAATTSRTPSSPSSASICGQPSISSTGSRSRA